MRRQRWVPATRYLIAACLTLGIMLQAGCAGAGPSPTARPTAVPSSTLISKPSPQTELQRVAELRRDWGLRSDDDWVRTVAADPDSIQSVLGIPVMAEEAADLEQMLREDPVTRLTAYGAKNFDSFGGLMIDPPGTNHYVMLFTGDLERHRAALAALPGAPAVELRGCQFTESEMKAVMDVIVADLGHASDPQLMSVSLDTRNNRVVLEAKSNTPGLQSDLEARYGGSVIVNLYPLPGPWANRQEGVGWRLLASGILRGASEEAYRVHAATTDEEWQVLWRILDTVNPAPPIEIGSEIAVSFAEGIGSGCPEVRLDDVVFDFADRVIYSVTSDPLAPRGCTADLVGAAFFVVALDRAALPDSPFTVRLWKDIPCGDGGCGGHPQEVTVDLEP